MPQMAPMNWLTLFLMFIMIFIVFNSLNYFSFLKFSEKSMTKFSTLKKTLTWKW